MDTFTGTVERITYYNEANSYGVVKVRPDKRIRLAEARDGTVTVVGVMPELGAGESASFTGEWIEDPKYGRQMRISTVTPITPNTLEGIKRYLASGIVRGIGQKRAEMIVDHFGINTLDILNKEPHRIGEVPGIKQSIVDSLARAWQENYSVRSTMIFLQGYGVTNRMAARILGEYGSETVERVQKNPYTLAEDVFGIGFVRADQIARSMGMPFDAPERVRAGLFYALNQLANEGHTYAPHATLIETTENLLGIDNPDRVNEVLGEALLAKDLIREIIPGPSARGGERASAIYLPLYHRAEAGCTKLLREMIETPSEMMDDLKDLKWGEFLTRIAQANSVTLSRQQQGAVKAALMSKVSVLTGGPGTGKTTTLQMVIRVLEEHEYTFALASPTGRAAKRLSEATERDASTLHRLLGYAPAEGFSKNEDDPLDVDMLIVDEASMIDLLLFYNVLKALPPEAHLMLVGDVDQLPSVGAGNVLHDVIDSGIAHVTRLETIFRQSEDSHIITNAHRINHGDMPFTDNQSTDFFFFGAEDPTAAAELVIDIVQNRLPNKFGFHPIEDIQVIAPMYRGPAGVNALNEGLQMSLNGDRRMAEKKLDGRTFRVGDKVMQTRNNYDKEVFNGDIGRIYAIDPDDSMLEVTIDGRFIDYDFTEAEELMHAYCISTHRSQGSEYPVVVLPLLTQHYMMLQRNLLYTAITRARKMVVIVGSRRALQMAVQNNKVAERYSGLMERLKA